MTDRRALVLYGSALGAFIFAVVATIGWVIIRRDVFNSSNDDNLAMTAGIIGYLLFAGLLARGMYITRKLTQADRDALKLLQLEAGLAREITM
jgi:hypothetical protein